MDLSELTTPAAIVDLDIVERNTLRLATRASDLSVRLRPHLKTHKSVDAGLLSVRGHFGGVTVSTLAEAKQFAAAGFRDITYAFPLSPGRLDEAVSLTRSLATFNLLVDHHDTVNAMETKGFDEHLRFRVFLEIDSGDHRGGVDPLGDAVVALARRLAESPQFDFRGLLTHAGQSYACRNKSEILEVARTERDVTVRCAERLRAEGIEVAEVSIGSTPTISVVDHLEGVTEVRPGNYVFHDAYQAAIGTCGLDDVAFTILTTVVGSYPELSKIIVDAGALALSKDRGPEHVREDCGYGILASPDLRHVYEDARITTLSQEHGQIHFAPGQRDAYPKIGDRLRVFPNHSCLTAALFDRYYVVQDGNVVMEWRPVRGW